MGGRSSKSGASKASRGGVPTQQNIDSLGNKMAELARYATPANYDRKKADQYYKVQRQFNEMRAQLNAYRDAQSAKRTSTKGAGKPFVNGYGEATTRNITNATYERAEKSLSDRVRRLVGGK